jgi:hypothetical protein
MRYVNAGVTCQTCHGEIQNMKRLYQAAAQHGLVHLYHIGQSNPPFRARYDRSSCHYNRMSTESESVGPAVAGEGGVNAANS